MLHLAQGEVAWSSRVRLALNRPDSFDMYATYRPSGEKRGSDSVTGDRANATAARRAVGVG